MGGGGAIYVCLCSFLTITSADLEEIEKSDLVPLWAVQLLIVLEEEKCGDRHIEKVGPIPVELDQIKASLVAVPTAEKGPGLALSPGNRSWFLGGEDVQGHPAIPKQ